MKKMNNFYCIKLFGVAIKVAESFANNLPNLDLNYSDISPQIQTISFNNGDFPENEFINEEKIEQDQANLDTWSVIWYIASFGGLILFFLIISCSEWCCRRNARRQCQRNNLNSSQTVSESPPPSYDHFAPPAYEDLWNSGNSSREKSKFDIYVVPVHAFGSFMEENQRNIHDDSPPSYSIAQNSNEARSCEIARIT